MELGGLWAGHGQIRLPQVQIWLVLSWSGSSGFSSASPHWEGYPFILDCPRPIVSWDRLTELSWVRGSRNCSSVKRCSFTVNRPRPIISWDRWPNSAARPMLNYNKWELGELLAVSYIWIWSCTRLDQGEHYTRTSKLLLGVYTHKGIGASLIVLPTTSRSHLRN
jgi:hypothetical protein